MPNQKNRWHHGGRIDLDGLNISLRKLDVVLNDGVVYNDATSVIFTEPITFSSNVTIGGTLSISATATLKGALSVAGAVTFASTLSVSADTTLKGALSVAGTVVFSSNLTVGGTLSVSAAATLLGTLSVGGTAIFSAGVTMGSTLTVSSSATLKSGLSVVKTTNWPVIADVNAGAGFLGVYQLARQGSQKWGLGLTSGDNFLIYDSASNQILLLTTAALSPPSAGSLTLGTSSLPWGQIFAPASVASAASLRIPHGTAPSAPVDGDMWTTTSGLFVRINGVTVGPLS